MIRFKQNINTQLLFYNILFKNYPSEIKRYIFKKLLQNKKYKPDCTLVIRSPKFGEEREYIWFDLASASDLSLFINSELIEELTFYLQLVDFLIVGSNKEGSVREFYLEFSNKRIDLVYSLAFLIKKKFRIECDKVLKYLNRIRQFLDLNKCYMIGFSLFRKKILEIEFSFNVKKEFLEKEISFGNFLSLFRNTFAEKFRGEQSYIITKSGKFFNKVGWMVDKSIGKYYSKFDSFLIHWRKSLRRRVELYANSEYARYLNIGWFSYIYSQDFLWQVNLNFNYCYE